MFEKINLLFLIFFVLQNTVLSIELSGIYDIEAIEKFVDEIDNKAKNNYKLTNVSISYDEKSIIVKSILNDLTEYLKKLNTIASDSRYHNYWQINIYNFMKIYDDYQVKSGLSKWGISLAVNSIYIEVKREIIDKYVRALLFFQENYFFENYKNVRSYLLSVISFISEYYHSESIADFYHNFVSNFLIEMYYADNWLNFCGQKSSLNKELFDYYRLVMTPYIKIWTMNYFGEILKARCNNDDSNNWMETARKKLIDTFTTNIKLTKKLIMENNKQYMYQCDSGSITDGEFYKNYIEGKKLYYELEKMVQAVIINEKDLTTSESCSYNCELSEIENTINFRNYRKFIECQYIASSFNICKSNQNSSRSYEWFNDSNGIIYGESNNKKCQNTIEYVDSYYNALKLHDCDYCVCICVKYPERKENVITAISFRDQVSNIKDDMVVVGVRFVKKDYMIHVQIKEGKLGVGEVGTLNRWNDLENFDYDEKLEEYRVMVDNSTTVGLTLGLDYGHPEILNFDDVMAPQGYVVTGVRFRFAGAELWSPNMKSGPIELQIRVSPFDYIKKKIIDHHQTHWMSAERMDKRVELILTDPDKPTKSSKNIIDSKPGQFIKFRASDLRKDAAQSTVPFFDAVPVEGNPTYSLGGIGIVHRGCKGFGGYLAFRIYDLDISHYFKLHTDS
ncbi:uncharacterized protein LOC106693059 [Microplitis demolitor]|uniref:uncharacterized protein LOC106693059 n=1 Tax=Microplitis demolitor TaxID=69319 RepID=UPI0004CD1906|nr:uncharacterized protein LOC106693059 [Microplitis demolitor]